MTTDNTYALSATQNLATQPEDADGIIILTGPTEAPQTRGFRHFAGDVGVASGLAAAAREGLYELSGTTDNDIADTLRLAERNSSIITEGVKYYVSGGSADGLRGKLIRRNGTALPSSVGEAAFRTNFGTYWETILEADTSEIEREIGVLQEKTHEIDDGAPKTWQTVTASAANGGAVLLSANSGSLDRTLQQLIDAFTGNGASTIGGLTVGQPASIDLRIPEDDSITEYRFTSERSMSWISKGNDSGFDYYIVYLHEPIATSAILQKTQQHHTWHGHTIKEQILNADGTPATFGGGGDNTVAGLSLTLVGTSNTLTGTAANIPKVGGGNVTRDDLSDAFLVDLDYTRNNANLKMTGLVLKSDLTGTAEYKFQLQGAGGDYIALEFDAAGDTANLTASDEANGVSAIVVRIFNTEPATTGRGGGGPTVTWVRPTASQDSTVNGRTAETVFSSAAGLLAGVNAIGSPSNGDIAYGRWARNNSSDASLIYIYGTTGWILSAESLSVSPYTGTPTSGSEDTLEGAGISVWDPDIIYPVNWVVIHDIAGHQGWQMYRKRTNTQTLATQPNPQVTQHWDRLTNDFGADRIPTDDTVPGSHAGSAYVQNWLDYYGADVPLHKAYWSTGVANNPFTAPDAFEALVSDLTQLGTLAHGDTLLIEITANIPSTATYHLNLQYKQLTGNSDTLTSENIRVVDGHQVIAHDIRYLDTTQTRGKLDIDGSVAGTGSGSVRVDSIVHFDGTLSGKDKETISSVVALVEERLLALDRFRGIWNSREAYFVGQMVIHNMNLYICIRDVPARPIGTQANDGPRVSTDYWEAVSAFQGEWQSGNWYGEGNTFLYTLNADQYNEEQQLYLVVGRIDGTTASTAPPNNPNVVRIDTAGAIAQIADWAKTGNVSDIPPSKLPQVQITRRNARMVVNYDGADVANEFQFPQASPTLDGAMAAADKAKLNTIQENAKRHIQTDWDLAGDVEGGILNKPALAPSNAQRNVQSDWNETDTASDAFIRNKPSGTGGAQRTFPEIAAGLNALTGMDRVSYNQLRNKVPAATQSVDGTMSSVDKTKLDQLNQWTVESEWENDHDYVVGDIVVRMNAMARCIQAHTSVTGSANDPAFSGVVNGYWELILHAVLETADTGFSRIILDYQGVTGSTREHNSVGMVYGGAWIAPTQQNTNQAYRWQSVRTHSGATYVCTEPHTATLAEPREPGTTGGASYWDVLPGL